MNALAAWIHLRRIHQTWCRIKYICAILKKTKKQFKDCQIAGKEWRKLDVYWSGKSVHRCKRCEQIRTSQNHVTAHRLFGTTAQKRASCIGESNDLKYNTISYWATRTEWKAMRFLLTPHDAPFHLCWRFLVVSGGWWDRRNYRWADCQIVCSGWRVHAWL